jgi:hypothetical protein
VDVNVRKVLYQHRQRTDVVVVGVRDEGMIDVPAGVLMNQIELRQAIDAFFFGIGSGIEDKARPADFQKQTACANIIGIAEGNKNHGYATNGFSGLLRSCHWLRGQLRLWRIIDP